MERKQETTAVKRALAEAGYVASVKHGTGTAWGWLHIKLDREWRPNDSDTLEKITKIALAVTDRRNDDNILVSYI